MNISSNNQVTEQGLIVQTTQDEGCQNSMQQQIVVTPSPVHFTNHSQYSNTTSSEFLNENGLSLDASELSPLQRQMQETLHISNPPSITIARTAFFPNSPQLSADSGKDSNGNHPYYPSRRVDTIAPVRNPKYYTSDRFIRPCRVATYQGNTILSPSSFGKTPTPSISRDPNFVNFHTEEASIRMNTNQENRNPNLPLGPENDR